MTRYWTYVTINYLDAADEFDKIHVGPLFKTQDGAIEAAREYLAQAAYDLGCFPHHSFMDICGRLHLEQDTRVMLDDFPVEAEVRCLNVAT